MAIKIDLIAPQPPVTSGPQGQVVQSSAMMLQRWLKAIGDKIIAGEPLVELLGNNAIFYVHAPANGTLSSTNVTAGQNILSGHLLGQVSSVSKYEIDWNNLEQVTSILDDFLEKSKDFKSIKDASEALGQLLGIEENQVFFNMNTEDQNQFLQSVIDQYQSNTLSASEIARKMLVDLDLRPPQFAPYAPQAPNFGLGMRPPAPAGPGGMGGGGYNPAAYHPQQQAGQIAYPPQNPMPSSGHYDPNLHGYPPNTGGGGVGSAPVIPQPHAYPSYPVAPTHPVGGNPVGGHPVNPPAMPPSAPYPQIIAPDSVESSDGDKDKKPKHQIIDQED